MAKALQASVAPLKLVSGVSIAKGEQKGTLVLYNGKKKFLMAFDDPADAGPYLTAVEDVAMVAKDKSAVFVLIARRHLQEQAERLAASELAASQEKDRRLKLETEAAELRKEIENLRRMLQSSTHQHAITASAAAAEDWSSSSTASTPTSQRVIRMPSAASDLNSAVSTGSQPLSTSSPKPSSPLTQTASSTALSLQIPPTAAVEEEAGVIRGMTHRARLISAGQPLLSVRQRSTLPQQNNPNLTPKTHRRRLSEPFAHSWESPRQYRSSPPGVRRLHMIFRSGKHIQQSNTSPGSIVAAARPAAQKAPSLPTERAASSPLARFSPPRISEPDVESASTGPKDKHMLLSPHPNASTRLSPLTSVSSPSLKTLSAVVAPLPAAVSAKDLKEKDREALVASAFPLPSIATSSSDSVSLVPNEKILTQEGGIAERRYSLIVPQTKTHTPPQFLEFILSPSLVDPGTINTYLLCFRKWSTPPALFTTLKDRYVAAALQSVPQKKIVHLMRHWLDEYYEDDFKADPPLLEQLIDFIHRLAVDRYRELDKYLHTIPVSIPVSSSLLSVASPSSSPSPSAAGSPPTVSAGGGGSRIARSTTSGSVAVRDRRNRSRSIIGWMGIISPGLSFDKDKKPAAQEFLSFDLSLLANELCLVDQEIFRLLRPVELVSLSESNPSPSIRAQSTHFNILSNWIAAEIVTVPNISKRITVIKAIVRLGRKLKKARDFNALMAIIAGLNLHCVSRLKATWKALPSSVVRNFEELESFMDIVHNFKVYRDYLATCQPPLVPYFGLTVRDVTLLNSGVSDMTQGGINMDKMQLLATFCSTLVRYQTSSYGYTSDPATRAYIAALPQLSFEEAELDRFSILCESAPES